MKYSDIKREYKLYKPCYEKLQGDVLKIIKGMCEARKESIDVLEINPRKAGIKSLESIENNFDKKRKYKKEKTISSITEIPDIAGVRVVCYCRTDQFALSTIVDSIKLMKNFSADRSSEKSGEYKAIHIDIKKKIKSPDPKHRGEFCEIKCELQIRTALGDIWAKLDERYVTKNQRYKEQGDPQYLRSSISEILSGCENLWDMVKKKSLDKKINQK